MTKIITLGCGGGRHQTIDQTFKTGGFRIHDKKFKLHVDPGPGALLLSNHYGLDPNDLDSVLVSHAHPDHYSDAEVLIGAMSGENTAGKFIGSKSTVDGDGELGPSISLYHKRKAGEVISLSPGDVCELKDFDIEATPAVHSDSTGVGFKIETSSGMIGYTADTELFDDLLEAFEGVRVLLGNVTRPNDKRIDGHLCSDDFAEILEVIEPDLGIILHMGMLFLRNTPSEEASRIQDMSGVRTIPGYVGTEVNIDERIGVKRKREQEKLENFY